MKIKSYTFALLLTLSSVHFAVASDHLPASDQEAELSRVALPAHKSATLSVVTSWIVDKIKDRAQARVGSFLEDLIFGSSGPSYVNLSQESLDEIRDIISDELANTVQYDMISDLRSLETGLEQYHAGLQNGRRDEALLALIDSKAQDLVNHQIFNTAYYDDAKLLTAHFALAASLRLAILVEKVDLGYISDGYLVTVGRQLADELSAMGGAARTYVNSQVFTRAVGSSTQGCQIWKNAEESDFFDEFEATVATNQPKADTCPKIYVYDRLGNTTRVFAYQLYGSVYATLAYRHRDTLRSGHLADFRGENYAAILSDLQGL